jgi:hypothetical protein
MTNLLDVNQQENNDFYDYEMGGLRVIPADRFGVSDII